jgi:hypothetical protein
VRRPEQGLRLGALDFFSEAADQIARPARPVPGARWLQACSFRHPTCVHAPPATASSTVLDAISAVDRAWDTLSTTLELPAPDADVDGAWHAYLVDSVEGGGTAQPIALDPLARYARASSFALIDRATPAGCPLDLAAARAVAGGALWRAAPSTDPGSATAETEALARLATACAASDGDTAAFQAEPERALVDARTPAFARGAQLFFQWLDAKFARQPGALLGGLWALTPSLASTLTPSLIPAVAPAPNNAGTRDHEAGVPNLPDGPTGFDVLRVSLRDALWPGSTFDDILTRFAVDRYLAPGARPRVAWRIPWPSAARRFAGPRPLAPTGASYLLVDGIPASGAKLRLEAQWEDYARMRWVVVKLDPAGMPMAELPVTSPDPATRASLTVESLDGVAGVLVVGVHLGSTEHPFDPRQGEWEPHGWLLTVEGE